MLAINAEADLIRVSYRYWSRWCSKFEIARISRTFNMVLASLMEKIGGHIGDIETITPEDQHQIWQWNGLSPQVIDACIHEEFTKQVLVRPDAPAICGWDGNFTYIQLDIVTSRLAHHLSDLRVGPEVMVPLCFEKSVYTIIAMIAVLKVGGACVALNPDHPKQHLQYLISETRASVVLASSQYSKLFENIVDHVLSIEQSFIDTLRMLQAPHTKRRTNGAAFVVFTSGSTGKPKGIILEHKALCTSIYAHGAYMGFNAASRVLQFASYTFDASLTEIFTTLLHGGCVCVPDPAERVNNLAGAITQMGIDLALLTPTVAGLIMPAEVPGLKTLTLGGEALNQALVDRWAGRVRLINIYGPAECSIWSSGMVLSSETLATTIGRGLSAILWVADPIDHSRLTPIGGIGELLIEGPLLAREYLNQPDKTSAAFIHNPTWLSDNNVSRRLYKTGDLVRYNTDGTLSYIARKDTQVKLNGQRLELAEIEYQIMELGFPTLRQVAVDIVMSGSSNGILAAFFEIDSLSEDMDVAGPILALLDSLRAEFLHLQASLANLLPSFMVPSLFIPLHRMPTSASGKLDRRVLRQIGLDLKPQLAQYSLQQVSKRSPSSRIEKRLQRAWAQVLHISEENIGADDHFFRCGGDSVAAMRLVATARKAGLNLTVALIFSKPKLSSMALAVRESSAILDTINALPLPLSLLGDLRSVDTLLQTVAAECSIEREQIEDIYPCTSLQEGLMTISTTTHPGTYLSQMIFRLPPNMDLTTFQKAWEQIVATHGILRTRIIYTPLHGSLQVVIRDTVGENVNWQSGQNLESYLRIDRDIQIKHGGILARYGITRDSGGQHFVWTLHHALYDGWTIRMILQQVEQIFLTGSIPKSVPFSKFIGYLTRMETESSASAQFWGAQLSGNKPSYFPQAASITHQPRPDRKQHHSMIFSRSSSSGITLSSLLRAAWAILLSRYCASNDIIFGAPLSGRTAPVYEIDEIVGPTLTTVPIKISFSDRELKVAEFLQAIQKQATDMIPFEHVGLQRIRRLKTVPEGATDLTNQLVIQPLMESVQQPSFLGLEALPLDVVGFDSYALVMVCGVEEGRVDMELRYDSMVLSTEQAKRVLQHFEHVILQLIDDPSEKRVDEVNIFTESDRQQIMTWKKGPQGVVVNKCIHEMITKRALDQPNAPAICGWDGELSYTQLDYLSSKLAQFLASQGITPGLEVPVGLCFDKSIWAVVAMLGVLKAGGVVLSLNFANPIAHNRTILTDAQAKLVLTSSKFASLFEDSVAALVVEPALLEGLGAESTAQARVDPDQAAVLIFTSGTTGRPKGVVLRHSSLCTMAENQAPHMRIGPSTRVFHFAAYSFDVSHSEILTTLMHGGCVCVPSEFDRMNNLVGAVLRFKANWLFLTPTMVKVLTYEVLECLETLVLGGEQVSQEILRKWATRVHLINSYGPSENSIWTSMAHLIPGRNASNIGHGLATRTWVVDEASHERLCPVGMIGELLLEGPLLAREYLNDPDKTASSFICSPAWLPNGSAETRLYKTGDLVRYDTDGSLIYVGRKDTQIKLRGQRVEIDEIEYHLSLNDTVQQAVVIMPVAGPAQKQLVAVLVLDSTSTMKKQEGEILDVVSISRNQGVSDKLLVIQAYLSDRLPEYFVPAVWIVVKSALPMNTSGKLDRARINDWVESMDESLYQQVLDIAAESSDQATNSIELQLRTLWSEVLGIPLEKIGLNRPFTSLGGDSITAMQIRARCRALNIAITVEDILRSKGISHLAPRIQLTSHHHSLEETFDAPFPLSPIQQLYFDQIAAGSHHYNQSLLVKLTGRMSEEAVSCAVEAVVSRHSMLRARFTCNNRDDTGESYWTQHILTDVIGNYSYQSLTVETTDDIFKLAPACQASLDITTGPVFAVCLFKLQSADFQSGETKQYIFLVAHHLVVDLVSWRIILSDLQDFLRTGTLTKDIKPLSFQGWCHEQATYFHNHHNAEIVMPTKTALADFEYWGMVSQAHNNTFDDILQGDCTLDSRTTALLFGGSNDSLRTEPVDLILSALLVSFQTTFSDRPPPTVFCESHGRESWDPEVNLSETVGWFTTIHPVSVSAIEHTDNQVETVRNVKDTRRKIPKNGWTYFASRYLANNRAGKEELKRMEVLFNYFGRSQQLEHKDSLFHLEGEGAPSSGKDTRRLALFEISVMVRSDSSQAELATVSFAWNRHMRYQSQIRNWIRAFGISMEQITRTLADRAVEYTLSDFPLLQSLTYSSLEHLKQEKLPALGIKGFHEVEDLYPCSPMQRGIILSQIKAPETYRVVQVGEVAPKVLGDTINVPRLKNAWQMVINRHSILRTIFFDSAVDDVLFGQLVLKHHNASVSVLNCNDENAVEFLQNQPALEHRKTRPQHQFTMCKTPSGRIFFKVEISHALIDGTSMAILTRDLNLAYENRLPQPGPQYSDLITYLQQRNAEERSLQYWKLYLADIKPCQLPVRSVNDENSYSEHHSIPVQLNIQDMRQFCTEHSVTLANLFQAAWSLVLRCYSGSDDVAFGYLTSGRDIPINGIYDVVGPFINMLICRPNISGETILQLVEKIRDDMIQGLEHQHTSLIDIQHALGHGKLFNTCVSLQRQMVEPIKENDAYGVAVVPLATLDPTEVSLFNSEFKGTIRY